MTAHLEGFRMSPQQRRVWQLQQAAGAEAFSCRGAVLVEGFHDRATLRAALHSWLGRHEILRTVYRRIPSVNLPVQVILEPPASWAAFVRETEYGGSGTAVELAERFLSKPRAGFDLDAGFPIRIDLLWLGTSRALLGLDVSPMAVDNAGLAALIRDLAAVFVAESEDAKLPAEPMQYADVAEWRIQMLEMPEGASGRAYWKTKTRGGASCSRWRATGFDPRRVRLRLDAIMDRIRECARHTKVECETILELAWRIVWERLTDFHAPLLGVEAECRSYEELADSPGPLATILPCRFSLAAEDKAPDALSRLQRFRSEAFGWQDFFAWDDLTDIEGVPVCPVSFAWRKAAPPIAASGARFELLGIETLGEGFEMRLSCEESGPGLTLTLDYDGSLHGEAEAVRMLERLQTVLNDLLSRPGSRIDELELTGARESQLVVTEFNGNTRPRKAGLLHELVEAQCRATPGRVAVEDETSQLTYAELDARADRLARGLAARGFGPEHIVAIRMERSAELVVAILGVLKAGAAWLPLEPSHPSSRIAYMLRDSGACAVIDSVDQFVAGPEAREPIRPEPDHAAYMIYTSGTTGNPKGVIVEHRQIVNQMLWLVEEFGFGPDDVFLQKTPFGFDASVWEFFAPLITGAKLLIAAPGGHSNLDYLARRVSDGGVTILQMVPSLLRSMLENIAPGGLASIRLMFCGGEALGSALLEAVHGTLGVPVVNLYGPTETTIQVSSWRAAVGGAKLGRAVVPIGRPIANARLYVLDAYRRPQPIGAVGELFVGGEPVARGYHGMPDLTLERFLPDPFSTEAGARMYRTGDRAAWREDGCLVFHGRNDNQVKIRGFRLELEEIEKTLETHPAVSQACVIFEAMRERLVAFLSGADTVEKDEDQWRAFLLERLPSPMIPAQFVFLEELPLTRNGKIDRRALEALAVEWEAPRAAMVGPRDSVELRMAHLWERLLGIAPIGVTDSFFDLGGHSLLAVRLLAEVKEEFGIDLPLSALFGTPTIESLVEKLETEQPDAPTVRPLVPIHDRGDRPPLFFVHPTGGSILCYVELARRLGTDQPFFGFQDPGLYPGGPAFKTIGEMAQTYVESLQEAHPDGPVLLGGWSSGGVVALEMARQLIARGRDVATVMLIDSQALTKAAPSPDERRLLESVVRLIAYVSGEDQSAPELSELVEHALRGDYRELIDLAKRAAFLPRRAGETEFERLFGVFRNHVRILQAHEVAPYPRMMTLLRASEPLPEQVREAAVHQGSKSATLDWDRIGSVEVHHLPANHLDILSPPGVDAVANIVREITTRVEGLCGIANALSVLLAHR